MENVSRETPLYVITEGSEPQYFTRFFTWDSAKSAVSQPPFWIYSAFGVVQTSRAELIVLSYELFQMHGNSFERKLSIVRDGVKPRTDVRFLYPVLRVISIDSWDYRCA
jgi:gelsolin